uniref:G-protein coupled receptors family 1 profile domain-containing protein n=1 Tax=Periophthalmus magnuspinnatus TaxID=409849 RepID=A0A3B4BJI7_9GOBI
YSCNRSCNDTRLLANLSLLSPHDDCHMSPILTACLVVWYSVTMVLGLVGNIANVTSIFICNLSFSDILVCVFCLPFTVIYTLMDHWVFGALMCRLVPFIQCVSVTVSSQRVTHSRRINIMLVALITAFALCWLPLTIFNVLSDWKQEALPVCHHNLLFSLCHLLAMSSTCINPIIYGFLNSNFRQEVRDVILHCRWRPVEESEHYPMSTVQMEMSRSSMPQNCRSNSI